MLDGTVDPAVGALHALIAYALDACYRDLHRVAQQIHFTLDCFTDALDRRDADRADVLRWSLRNSLSPYLERTAPAVSGTCRALHDRFSPLHAADVDSDTALLTAAERFLSIVYACFHDADQIVDEAVAATLARNRADRR